MADDVLNHTGCAVRLLPVEEWHRLEGLPFAQNGLPDPNLARILVAETPEGEIVGIWAAMAAVHLDGLWVAPSYRRASWVAVKLLKAMKVLLIELGIVQSFTIIESAEVLALATKAGFTRIRGDLCLLDLSRVMPAGEE
jgi:hypothetical protein